MANGKDIPVLLMTGLTSTVSAQGQTDLFKEGYGDREVLSFGHQNISGLLSSINSNPNSPVVLYSAGGKYSYTVAQAISYKENLFILEPYNSGVSGGTANSVKNAIKNSAVPSSNVITGPSAGRGNGILSQFQITGATNDTSSTHFKALTYMGNIIKQKYPPPFEEPISQDDGPLSEPTFSVYADKSDVIGTIVFFALEDGYSGEIKLTNFPEGYIKTQFIGTAPIQESNYETLKTEALKLGQEFLDSLKVDEVDFGVLQIGDKPIPSIYKIVGKIVNERHEALGGVSIKDTTNNSSTTSEPTGDFIIEGTYEVDDNPPTEEITKNSVFTIIGLYDSGPDEGKIYPGITGKITFNELGPKKEAVTTLQGPDPTTGKIITLLQNSSGPSSFSPFETLAEEQIIANSRIGVYKLQKELSNPTVPDPNAPLRAKPFDLTISLQDYNTESQKPVNGDGSIKASLGVIQLIPIQAAIEEDIMEQENYSEDQIKLLKANLPKKDFVTILVNKLLDTIKSLLMPTIIEMIAQFGVTNLQQLLDKAKKEGTAALKKEIEAQIPSCPADIEGLNKVIEFKNQLTKQLNNLYKGIESITKALNIPVKIIDGVNDVIPPIKGAIAIVSFTPSTAVTPIPVGPILIAKDAIRVLEDLIDKIKPHLSQNTFQLNFLKENFNKVINLLNMLDILIEGCAEELGGTPQEQEQISLDLLNSTQQQSNQLSPVVINVNGFEMSVITVDNVTIGGLKRRRAIAQNTQGVTMLQGEPSFSSNDQILIDELVYYIQTNDLKAD